MDMLQHHAQNHAKQENCFKQLQSMGIVPKSKMFKFYRNVSQAWVEMDKEFVNCRRYRHLSAKYEQLEQTFNECINTFEQWSVMAALMY